MHFGFLTKIGAFLFIMLLGLRGEEGSTQQPVQCYKDFYGGALEIPRTLVSLNESDVPYGPRFNLSLDASPVSPTSWLVLTEAI